MPQRRKMDLFFCFTCVFLLLASRSHCAPLRQLDGDNPIIHQGEESQNDWLLASKYLQQFYSEQTPPPGRRKRSQSSFPSRLNDMQRFFGLNQTGRLNAETLTVMKTPRCGVPDVQEYVSNRANKWNKNTLTYTILRYTSDIPMNTVDRIIESAFDVWARASSLRFYKSSSQQADIVVDFAPRYHGDTYPFDGPRGVLAHAFDPGEGIGGDVHFDDDENWTKDSQVQGINLYQVAAHEFGHALGLRHSHNPDSLMYPTYKNRQTQNILSSEDIININALYGPSSGPSYYKSALDWLFSRWYPRTYYPFSLKDKCSSDQTFDSVTTIGKSMVFFKDSYMWIKNKQNRMKEGPINSFMPNINSSIDAAYWLPQSSDAFFFTGNRYWTMKGLNGKGKHENISTFGFPKWVNQIDAAVHVPQTPHTLFFIQDQYWRYNENKKAMEDSAPGLISDNFPGIETPISAAVYANGSLHFFVQAQVFQYDVKGKKILAVNEANSWLGC